MKALIQRVTEASVHVEGKCIGSVSEGLLVLLGIEKHDSEQAADKLVQKVLNYRVFDDASGRMNLSVQDVKGGVLAVSQFTLAANTDKGRRPSFSEAATPESAERLYDYFVGRLKAFNSKVATGQFGADMKVSLINNGPVTFMLEV